MTVPNPSPGVIKRGPKNVFGELTVVADRRGETLGRRRQDDERKRKISFRLVQ